MYCPLCEETIRDEPFRMHTTRDSHQLALATLEADVARLVDKAATLLQQLLDEGQVNTEAVRPVAQYICKPCNFYCQQETTFMAHEMSQRHLNTVAQTGRPG